MRRLDRRAAARPSWATWLDRAPAPLRNLLGVEPAEPASDLGSLELSARRLGRVLQFSVANETAEVITGLELAVMVEFFDRQGTEQERRTVDYLAPGEEILLAIPISSTEVSRVWCASTYVAGTDSYTATGVVDLH